MTVRRNTRSTIATTLALGLLGSGLALAPGASAHSGGGAGILIGIVLLLAVLIGGYFLLNQGRHDALKTKVFTDDLDSVGGGDARVRIVQASVMHKTVDAKAGSTGGCCTSAA